MNFPGFPRQPGSHLAGSQMTASSHAALPEIEEEEAEEKSQKLRVFLELQW